MKSDTLSDTMRIKEELKAQITKKSKTEYLISFWYGNKRYRYSNGRAIGLTSALIYFLLVRDSDKLRFFVLPLLWLLERAGDQLRLKRG
jgi:hypothetical protein